MMTISDVILQANAIIISNTRHDSMGQTMAFGWAHTALFCMITMTLEQAWQEVGRGQGHVLYLEGRTG